MQGVLERAEWSKSPKEWWNKSPMEFYHQSSIFNRLQNIRKNIVSARKCDANLGKQALKHNKNNV